MADADFNKPQLTDQYEDVLQEIRNNSAAQAAMFDDQSPANAPAGTKRWSTANLRWEQFDGSSWLELAAQYAINVERLQGLTPGNESGNIPVSNGTLNVNLNSQMLGGQKLTYFATAQAVTDLAAKEQADVDAINAKIDSSSTGLASKVSKTGDTMTGSLKLKGNVNIQFLYPSGAGGPYISWDANSGSAGFVDQSANNWNLRVTDNGFAIARADVQAINHYATGRFYSSAAAGSGVSGVLHSTGNIGGAFGDWGARVYAVQVDSADPGAAYGGIRWTQWGQRHLAAIDAYAGGSNATSPWISFHIGSLTNAWIFNGNDISRSANGGYVWGSWNFDPNSKIGGAQCNWNTGVGEWGPMAGGEWAARYDVPAPYVMVGLYCSYSNGDFRTAGVFLRGVALRNY